MHVPLHIEHFLINFSRTFFSPVPTFDDMFFPQEMDVDIRYQERPNQLDRRHNNGDVKSIKKKKTQPVFRFAIGKYTLLEGSHRYVVYTITG